jgi:hypothetical protein
LGHETRLVGDEGGLAAEKHLRRLGRAGESKRCRHRASTPGTATPQQLCLCSGFGSAQPATRSATPAATGYSPATPARIDEPAGGFDAGHYVNRMGGPLGRSSKGGNPNIITRAKPPFESCPPRSWNAPPDVRIEELGPGDFVKVDSAARHHVTLTPEALLRVGLSAAAKGSRPQSAAALPRVREEGAGGGFGEVAGTGRVDFQMLTRREDLRIGKGRAASPGYPVSGC